MTTMRFFVCTTQHQSQHGTGLDIHVVLGKLPRIQAWSMVWRKCHLAVWIRGWCQQLEGSSLQLGCWLCLMWIQRLGLQIQVVLTQSGHSQGLQWHHPKCIPLSIARVLAYYRSAAQPQLAIIHFRAFLIRASVHCTVSVSAELDAASPAINL